MSNLELPADMTVASCRVVVATRDLIAIIHRDPNQEFQAAVHEWFWFW
jgi:hypothetical protein